MKLERFVETWGTFIVIQVASSTLSKNELGLAADKVEEFFQKVDQYIKGLYQRFVISGKLTTLLYKREIPFDRIESANEQKVFNYLLQSLETEINYMKIGEVLEYLEGKMSKMILYTYDAFLIDTHPIERENLLNDIREIMEKGGFPVKIEEGENYNNLEVIS